jgi:hypothetical protein
MDGSVIGLISSQTDVLDYSDAFETTQAIESLVYLDSNENGDYEDHIAVANLDSTSGQIIWSKAPDNSIIEKRTVCMSQMASMLNDKDRSECYNLAINKLISYFKNNQGFYPTVLDVGTGTGLLAMLAAKHGATRVIACEMFSAMAEIAEKVVAINSLDSAISIKYCKSMDLSMETEAQRADLLISELLDSALLGESCLFSHHDAIKRLIKSEKSFLPNIKVYDRVIPYSGTVSACIIQSDYIRKTMDINNIGLNRFHVWRDGVDSSLCKGGQRLLPVHWYKLEEQGGIKLSEMYDILNVPFANPCLPINLDLEDPEVSLLACVDTEIIVEKAGRADGLLLWWKVYLLSPEIDPDRTVMYTTQPGVMNWQDHWLQCIFPLADPISCNDGDILKITAAYDWSQIYLDINQNNKNDQVSLIIEDSTKRVKKARNDNYDKIRLVSIIPSSRDTIQHMSAPSKCVCGWHLLCGFERLQMLTDQTRHNTFSSGIDNLIDSLQNIDSTVLTSILVPIIIDLADGSLLGIEIATKLRQHEIQDIKVISKETKMLSRLFHSRLVDVNNLSDYLYVWDGIESWSEVLSQFITDDDNSNSEESEFIPCIVGVISECFSYQLSTQPTWQVLHYYYACRSLHQYFHPQVCMVPKRARIMVVAIELSDLHISHGTVNT